MKANSNFVEVIYNYSVGGYKKIATKKLANLSDYCTYTFF